MDRYLNVTETRQGLLELIERLEHGDRIVITKRGTPRAVLVDFERYSLLEDLAWILRDPSRRTAMQDAWERAKRGRELVQPPRGAEPSVATMRKLIRKGAHRRRSKG
ncbi:MAG: type II toxin-antitoxin system Phd/YefM family antitoxin [Candidatus Binatia bacterium]